MSKNRRPRPRREEGVAVRLGAIEILVRVETGAWADRLLQHAARALEDPRDRGLLHALVWGVLRWQGALDGVLEEYLHRPLGELLPTNRWALRLGLLQALVLKMPTAIAVSTAVGAAREAAGRGAANLVNAVLHRAVAGAPERLDPRSTIPAWLLRRWESHLGGEKVSEICAAINLPARPHLMALARAGEPENLRRRLREEGISTKPSSLLPRGLHVLDGAPQLSSAFEAGEYVLLDESAAMVAGLARPAGEGLLADLSVAPGGKAALILDQAEGSTLVGIDIVASRLAAAERQLRRCVEPHRFALAHADARRPPVKEGAFRLVLLDAPCSGTGTLRRRPDKRWRLAEEQIEAAARTQRQMLESAARLVAPGGALLYAVCSLEPEEGVEQVAGFLGRHPGFEAEDPRSPLGESCGQWAIEQPRSLYILPLAGRDGFFAARLRRRGTSR